MAEVTAGRLAYLAGGKVVGGFLSTKIRGIAIDSRTIKPGELFVPLVGEASDGHDYIVQAVESGAAGFLTAKANGLIQRALSGKAFAIEVDDTLLALQRAAAEHRRALDAKVVGITGSTGKTTVRTMTSAVLRQRYSVVESEKNYNNEIGVPLTLLNASSETEIVVVEMGMRGPGQIAELAEIAAPEIGLITGIGQTHIELLGSVEAIAKAKGELIERLPDIGTAVLNSDDEWFEELAKIAGSNMLTFGLRGGDLRAENLSLDSAGRATFRIVGEGLKLDIALPVPGRHNVSNALGAAAVGLACGMTGDEIAAGLSDFVLPGMRMEISRTPGGVIVINDAYNASPDSMGAALDALTDMSVNGRRIAVLGDMLELGNVAEGLHRALGEKVAEKELDLLVTVGELGEYIAEGARQAGHSPQRVKSFDSANGVGEYLADILEPGDIVLVKASRGMRMEKIVERIL